jgi:predicted nucleic acid-binding protein
VGVLLDSSVSIKCERLRLTETQMLKNIRTAVGEVEIGLSSIALTELLHGVYRARDPIARSRRQLFLDALVADVIIFPYLFQTATLAGQIGGEQAAIGKNIPPVDLMIGATALSLSFSLLTVNLRHFRMIPNLNVIPF